MYLLLVLSFIAICAYTAIAGAKEYKVFKGLKKTAERQYWYLKWIKESWLYFGAVAVLGLVLVDESSSLFYPLVQQSLTDAVPDFVKSDPDSMSGFIAGVITGLAVAVILMIRRARKSLSNKIATIGDVEALLPRNNQERKLALLTAISAGINEELFFRAAMPVLLFGLFHNAVMAILTSVLIFGIGHYYQGWKGVLGTTIMGLILMKVFIMTGNIIAPIALHILIDIWGLLLVPYIVSKIRPPKLKTT